ncbi:cupin domain-containing protein [Solimicrobium silvestre]|uniref:Mannose-6-phosphate isomerase n=1 Tax=Solimicrobium silvestre TaxID=2099400 RepID=A0A2S9GU75_9BURK|nr:cupin domain-containing protein [Solimicrobium silvestre]PRC91251.1 Mannose-6-phosphate isomerase [Solimicrobium silvestre]
MTIKAKISDTNNAEYYIWGEVCDGWHLLKTPDLSVIQERVPPGAGEVRHFHTKARQYFYVLSGQATLEFNDGEISFGANQGVHVEPGVHHRFKNVGDTDVVFMVISSPSTKGDRENLG